MAAAAAAGAKQLGGTLLRSASSLGSRSELLCKTEYVD